jgi:hypothetical protein
MQFTAALFKNYLTSIFGVLASVPVMVLGIWIPGTPMALPPVWTRIVMETGAVGLLGLGIVAKAFNIHSTIEQAQAAQAVVEGKPEAPALVKAADAQVDAAKANSPPKP